ncbi:MAG TPA: hypothetical protein PKW21_00380 [Rhabdaerophilum sp.]|nr:hypothetical protein [Rhabdaerophilum sp.]
MDRRHGGNIADPVAERIGIDPAKDALGASSGADGLGPAGAVVILQHRGQTAAGGFGLHQCTNAVLLQRRDHGDEDARGQCRVGERIVAVIDTDVQIGCELVEREAGQARVADLAEKARIEDVVPERLHIGYRAFALEYGEIEADVVPDDDAILAEFRQWAINLLECRCILQHAGMDAVDARGFRRNGNTGVDLAVEDWAVEQHAMFEDHSADLKDPHLRRVEPRRFGVEENGFKRGKRMMFDGHDDPPG